MITWKNKYGIGLDIIWQTKLEIWNVNENMFEKQNYYLK